MALICHPIVSSWTALAVHSSIAVLSALVLNVEFFCYAFVANICRLYIIGRRILLKVIYIDVNPYMDNANWCECTRRQTHFLFYRSI